MPHKLLLTWDFKGYVVRDDVLDFKISVDNIGDTAFSGKFASIALRYPEVSGSISSQELPTISNLLPMGTFVTPSLKLYVMNHGLSWIQNHEHVHHAAYSLVLLPLGWLLYEYGYIIYAEILAAITYAFIISEVHLLITPTLMKYVRRISHGTDALIKRELAD